MLVDVVRAAPGLDAPGAGGEILQLIGRPAQIQADETFGKFADVGFFRCDGPVGDGAFARRGGSGGLRGRGKG